MRKANILMVGPFPENLTLIKGGVQASVLGLSLGLLQRDDVSVQVFALPVNKHTKQTRTVIEGIDVTYLNMPLGYQMASILHLPAVLRRIKAAPRAVLHIHGTGTLQTALSVFARMLRIPLIWTLHGITEKETLQRFREGKSPGSFGRYLLYRMLERTALRLNRAIIVDTPYVKGEVSAHGNTIHVIPQGINTEELARCVRPRDNQPPRILSLGAMDTRKGHHLTLKAFARVKQQLPQASLIIMGTLTVPEYYVALIAQAAELGLSDSVEIVADASRSEILAQLGEASVFALHSQEESQGIALCEAHAAALPIVATRVGGIPYVVNDGRDGLLVAYGDVDGFADALLRLLTDRSLSVSYAKEAQVSCRRFDWRTITESVVGLYLAQV